MIEPKILSDGEVAEIKRAATNLTPQDEELFDLIATTRHHKRRAERFRAALPDALKLRSLAEWFDSRDARKGIKDETEVQDDLRKWADKIRKAQEADDAASAE